MIKRLKRVLAFIKALIAAPQHKAKHKEQQLMMTEIHKWVINEFNLIQQKKSILSKSKRSQIAYTAKGLYDKGIAVYDPNKKILTLKQKP
jgi:hypothetical protein